MIEKRIKFKFDLEKALEVILFIANKAPKPDIYHIGKIIYLADKIHLEKYGRFICGDNYIAMKYGPVPSGVYDIIKYVRGDGIICFPENIHNLFGVSDKTIIPCRKANCDLLSESDRECIDESISIYGHLSFSALQEESHDAAFESVDENEIISIEAIASLFKDSEIIIDYLRNNNSE